MNHTRPDTLYREWPGARWRGLKQQTELSVLRLGHPWTLQGNWIAEALHLAELVAGALDDFLELPYIPHISRLLAPPLRLHQYVASVWSQPAGSKPMWTVFFFFIFCRRYRTYFFVCLFHCHATRGQHRVWLLLCLDHREIVKFLAWTHLKKWKEGIAQDNDFVIITMVTTQWLSSLNGTTATWSNLHPK